MQYFHLIQNMAVYLDNPQTVRLANGLPMSFYWSASPPQFCADKRTTDIESIIDTMEKAQKFVYIAVMDYMPAIVFDGPRRLVLLRTIN